MQHQLLVLAFSSAFVCSVLVIGPQISLLRPNFYNEPKILPSKRITCKCSNGKLVWVGRTSAYICKDFLLFSVYSAYCAISGSQRTPN